MTALDCPAAWRGFWILTEQSHATVLFSASTLPHAYDRTLKDSDIVDVSLIISFLSYCFILFKS